MYYQKTGYYNTKKHDGYDSKFEAGYAQELELRKKAGEIEEWEEQVTLELVVNGWIVCTYKIDFIVFYPDGLTEYVELKGFPTDAFKIKWKLFNALYQDKPNTKITIIYQGKNWRPRLRRKK